MPFWEAISVIERVKMSEPPPALELTRKSMLPLGAKASVCWV